MILYPNSESVVNTSTDAEVRILNEVADTVQIVEDVAITEYVRYRLAEYKRAGGQLKAFAIKAKLAISTPSQVLSKKLGVGSRTAPRFAAGFDLTLAELHTLAEAYANENQIGKLTTQESLLEQALSTAHADAMRWAFKLGYSPRTIAKVNVEFLHMRGAPQWSVVTWNELFNARHRLDKQHEPERQQELRAEAKERSEREKKPRRRKTS